jgi:hypothetical protein|tara:strand:- start:10904 stop:11437 length:534 start_codon:yes stop_codon:yes gene_type:complete
MSNSSLSGKIKETFAEQFSEYSLIYEKVDLGNGKAHAFLVDLATEKELETIWQPIGNFIALHFQNKLEDQFERWNLYLFFKLSSPIQKSLKYKIENDTFSSRKIILEEKVDFHSAIDNHILNKLDNIGVKKLGIEKSLEHNPILLKELRGKTLRKIKTTPEASTSYNRIVEIIKKSL